MNLLVIGSGGREHALVWKLSQDSRVDNLYCAPGNSGMNEAVLIDIKITDSANLLEFAIKNNVDLTVVGPEVPLLNGIVNDFNKNGLRIFGPSAAASALEGSKLHAKKFMKKYSIPTAEFESFENAAEAMAYISEQTVPCVIKASGLAAGKGVIICNSIEDAREAIKKIMIDKSFGEAGNVVLIEELMEGEEASILVISDGNNYTILPSSQDHKRVNDDDEGLNTGGMGAYSPAPVVTKTVLQVIETTIVIPTIEAMNKEHTPYTGVLYIGIMLTPKEPKVVEYNVRFGDPEAQAIIPLIGPEFLDLLLASAKGDILSVSLTNSDKSSTCIVLSSKGYPGNYQKGVLINGLEKDFGSQTLIFHAGTNKIDSKYYTNGGRVLNIIGLGKTLKESIDMAYKIVGDVNFDGMHYRSDIGAKGLKHMKELSI